MTKSYVKIYGPPLCKALRTLEQIAIESPEVIASYYDQLTPSPSAVAFQEMAGRRGSDYGQQLQSYLQSLPVGVPEARKTKLISASGHTLGAYDFFFEWARDPQWKEVEDLICKIDAALAPLGCRYTITTT